MGEIYTNRTVAVGVGVIVAVFAPKSVGVGVIVGGLDVSVSVIAALAVPAMLVCSAPGFWAGKDNPLKEGSTHPDMISAVPNHKPVFRRILCFSLLLQCIT